MNLVDANVLLYAVNEAEPRSEGTREWLDAALVGAESVGFAWLVLTAFVRLSTKVGLFPNPLTVEQAIGQVRAWIGAPAAVIIQPTARHLDVFVDLIASVGTGGNLVNDAHLAALAIEHRGTVISYDRDFGRFAGVRWRHPGAPSAA
ncbi:MAG TPA: type II toxin-antitoxin system VapC family toxin [Actinomycetota bacterium]|nr:type II toxin-antitoxin system VapC family toxin [Actinomycetota bacterium]